LRLGQHGGVPLFLIQFSICVSDSPPFRSPKPSPRPTQPPKKTRLRIASLFTIRSDFPHPISTQSTLPDRIGDFHPRSFLNIALRPSCFRLRVEPLFLFFVFVLPIPCPPNCFRLSLSPLDRYAGRLHAPHPFSKSRRFVAHFHFVFSKLSSTPRGLGLFSRFPLLPPGREPARKSSHISNPSIIPYLTLSSLDPPPLFSFPPILFLSVPCPTLFPLFPSA